MPRLERMHQVSEYTRLQTEISILEQQIAELEASTGHTPVRSMTTQTDSHSRVLRDEVPIRSRYIGSDIKHKAKGMMPHDKVEAQGNSVTEQRHGGQLLTSTPKAEANIANNYGPLKIPSNTYNQSELKKSSGAKIKPATFDGTGNWLDYKAHFEVCAQLNGWTDDEKGMYLAVSLRGQAQGVFGNIASKSHNYSELVKALEERFAPPNQTELYRVQLRERKQKASETLSELGQDIRRLTNLAYPTAPSDLRETLAKEQFIDSLVNSDMRLRIKQVRPSSLNDAVRHAVELEAFNRAERRHLEGQGYMRSTSEKSSDEKSEGSLESDMRALQKTVSDLQKSFETWRNKGLRSDRNWKDSYKKQANYAKPKCFICGSEDHMKRNCPSRHNSRHHNTRSDTPKKAEAHQAKHVASASGGLYAECKINNIITECLINTGATLSILSFKAWDVISQSSSNELKKFSMQVFTASGSQIEVKGKTTVIIEI